MNHKSELVVIKDRRIRPIDTSPFRIVNYKKYLYCMCFKTKKNAQARDTIIIG